ncbi:MAG TPA: methylated-DNA--[protein]-cysteine S-methyltransferase [Candidatus Tumulicola sp.]|nr:methylated-DNA--[protein]-cysteine S-methyltransferase [Candidatus Tumulicola sp.]
MATNGARAVGRISTPLGRDLVVVGDGRAILEATFAAVRRVRQRKPADPLVAEAAAQVRAYFARRLGRFDLPLDPAGTPFARTIWELVASLSFGEFVSYADLARAAGRPLAHRGVARAMGQTPIALFVPAHRVVASDGRVRGAEPGSIRSRLVAFERYKPSRGGA